MNWPNRVPVETYKPMTPEEKCVYDFGCAIGANAMLADCKSAFEKQGKLVPLDSDELDNIITDIFARLEVWHGAELDLCKFRTAAVIAIMERFGAPEGTK